MAKSGVASSAPGSEEEYGHTIEASPALPPCHRFVGGVALVVWAAVMAITLPKVPSFSWDSAAYVETAQSLVAGRGLQHRVIWGVEPPVWEPLTLWPPGYPLLIAALHATGIPAPIAGIAVSIISSGVFVLTFSWICCRLLPLHLALPVALAGVCMSAFLTYSAHCLSDALYLALSTASLACLIRWEQPRFGPIWYLAGSGFLAGAALITRHVGVSLFVVSALFVFLSVRRLGLAAIVRAISAWALGAILCMAPVYLHNFSVSGGAVPYSMPPSEMSLWDNLRQTVATIVYDVSTSGRVTSWLVDKYVLTACLVAGLIATWLVGRSQSMMHWIEKAACHRHILLFVAYAITFVAIVVIARTKYRWGEPIYSRYLFPIYWMIWIGLATVANEALAALRIRAVVRGAVLGAVFAFIAAAQLVNHFGKLEQIARQYSLQPSIDDDTRRLLSTSVGEHQIVLACRADIWRIVCDISARKISEKSYQDIPAFRAPTREEMVEAGRSGFLWGVIIDDIQGSRDGMYIPWVQELVQHPEEFPELERVLVDSPTLIFRFAASDGSKK